MKKQDFENLIKSVKQAGKIRRGETSPAEALFFIEYLISPTNGWSFFLPLYVR
jgi:hypothetical protein